MSQISQTPSGRIARRIARMTSLRVRHVVQAVEGGDEVEARVVGQRLVDARVVEVRRSRRPPRLVLLRALERVAARCRSRAGRPSETPSRSRAAPRRAPQPTSAARPPLAQPLDHARRASAARTARAARGTRARTSARCPARPRARTRRRAGRRRCGTPRAASRHRHRLRQVHEEARAERRVVLVDEHRRCLRPRARSARRRGARGRPPRPADTATRAASARAARSRARAPRSSRSALRERRVQPEPVAEADQRRRHRAAERAEDVLPNALSFSGSGARSRSASLVRRRATRVAPPAREP